MRFPTDMAPARALHDFANADDRVNALINLLRRRVASGQTTRKGARSALGTAVDGAVKRYAALHEEDPGYFDIDPKRFDLATREYVADQLLAELEAQHGALPSKRARAPRKRQAERFVAIGGKVFKV